MTTIQRFWDKVDIDDNDCWNWTGSKNDLGYGRFGINGKVIRTHRYSYELFNKPIPKGLVIDHLCRNTSCCNPQHLEPVTQQENCSRGMTGQYEHKRRTHCKRGHKLTPENISYHSSNKHGRCKTCKNRMDRESYKRGKTL